MRKELKDVLLAEFKQEVSDRRTEMKDIVKNAVSALKYLEANLPKTSESQYYKGNYRSK